MRIRMDIAYDGTGFHGWAKQPGLRTVQGELEKALNTLLIHRRENQMGAFEKLHVTVAGRTDTGVHAAHQVTHFDVDENLLQHCVGYLNLDGISALEHRLRHILPSDIAILSLSQAPEGFDARFSALERTYIYRIFDGNCKADPRLRNCVLTVRGSLNVEAMDNAAQQIIGLHDFGSFATANPGGTTIRKVKSAHWIRTIPENDEFRASTSTKEVARTKSDILSLPGMIMFTIVADAFAHNMVRSLTNACVSIGLGKRTKEWFGRKINTPLREGSTGPIEPCGLTLEHVQYPPDDELAIRAAAIKAKRSLDD
ncbi:tRNA pseudouridine(38-40) synthase TruA [Bifidobacterium aquikefiri]|uniref:tRNA pseudouridine(38-40) synthase TruA n=2 Tax=Bifidobacterium aquikefiri TaxID=1653207 RepID=UPI0039EAE6C0